MREYIFKCDCCKKQVKNLYNVSFDSITDSQSSIGFSPNYEICEDCIKLIYDAIQHMYETEENNIDGDNYISNDVSKPVDGEMPYPEEKEEKCDRKTDSKDFLDTLACACETFSQHIQDLNLSEDIEDSEKDEDEDEDNFYIEIDNEDIQISEERKKEINDKIEETMALVDNEDLRIEDLFNTVADWVDSLTEDERSYAFTQVMDYILNFDNLFD